MAKNRVSPLSISAFIKNFSGDDGSVYRYRALYSCCFVIHTFYAILFWASGITELAVFNTVSSLIYFTGMVMIRTNRFTRLYYFLMYAEITSHGILCCHILGFEFQFTLFSMSIIPVAYFMSYMDPKFRKPMLISTICAVADGGGILVMLYKSIYFRPKYDYFEPHFINMVAQFNMTVSLLMMIMFSVLFLSKIGNDLKILRKQNDTLDFLANYDQLTGLRNRNHIRDIFGEYIKSTAPYCVILGDIDDFKHVNDTYGHSAGDDVLKMVASTIKSNVASNGVVCRWGGEEILILLKGTTENGIKLTNKILEDIRSTTVESGKYRIKVTMTFGLCDYGDAMDIEKLINLADKRLYIGKKSGKNRVVTESRGK